MTRKDLVERARTSVITTAAVPDAATMLARENMAHGLAKIHWVQEHLGYPADAFFLGSPDMTTPRYPVKWQWGQALGGQLTWGMGDRPLTFLDLQVSTSTAFFGTVTQEPDMRTVLACAEQLRRKRPRLMGVDIDWDFDRGNHFINVYRVEPQSQTETVSLAPYAFVVHGGDSEVKRPSTLGIGLDYEKSPPLRERMSTLQTPLGPVRVLLDQAARDYYEGYLRYEHYSKQKRALLSTELFGEHTVISNEIHHGFAHANTALLGCYQFQTGSEVLYPVTLRSDLPTYVVQGSAESRHDFMNVESLSPLLKEQVALANILPHGGGYTYPEVQSFVAMLEADGLRYSVLEGLAKNKRVLANLNTLPYAYRGEEVIACLERCRLGKVVAQLHPLFSLTT
jgi:hypothetical protein